MNQITLNYVKQKVVINGSEKIAYKTEFDNLFLKINSIIEINCHEIGNLTNRVNYYIFKYGRDSRGSWFKPNKVIAGEIILKNRSEILKCNPKYIENVL